MNLLSLFFFLTFFFFTCSFCVVCLHLHLTYCTQELYLFFFLDVCRSDLFCLYNAALQLPFP